MKKIAIALFVLMFAAQPVAAQNWVIGGDSKCVEFTSTDNRVVADPSFDTKSACQSFLARCGSYLSPSSGFCGPAVDQMGVLDRLKFTVVNLF